MSVASQALRHGRGVVFLAVAAALVGAWVVTRLPKGVYPELVFAREQVVATLPGASAENVQVNVTRRLEETLLSVPGVERVRSRTIRGAVEISLFFAEGTDMSQAHPLVLSRVAEARSVLPAETDVTAERVLASGFPILSLNVEGPYPPQRLYEIAQYTVRPALSGLKGAGLVTVQTSDLPETQVLLDPSRLEAAHVSVPDVAKRLAAANGVTSVARIEDAHELLLASVSGQLVDAAGVADVIVAGTPSAPLRVRDLGTVVEGVEPARSRIRVNGHPGVIINVARRVGGDILTLDKQAEDVLAALAPTLPPGVRIIPVYEQAVFVDDAVKSVRDAVLFGCALVVVILALFLRDWRSTLLASLSLPLTLGITFLGLSALGQTVNLMTLGGIAVAVGLVIDDAVVVIEAMHRHLEQGLEPKEAARRGTEELFWPVVGTTLTTVVVFLPLGLLTGVAGQFFVALSVALATAVLVSLLIALLVLPVLASSFLRPLRTAHQSSRLVALYEKLLDGALRNRAWVIVGAVVAVAIGALLATRVETGFLPEADEGAYVVDYFAPVGASLQEADRLASELEKIIAETEEVQSFSRRLGAELGPATATLSSVGDISVRLKKSRSRDIEEIMDEQRDKIAARVPGVRVEFIQVLGDVLGDLEGAPEPIEVKLYGPDPSELRKVAAEVSKRIGDVPGLVDLFNGDPGCAPERTLHVSPMLADRAGVTTADISDQLSGSFLGEVSTQLRKPDHLENVRVRLALPDSPEMSAFNDARVVNGSGGVVPIAALGSFADGCAPAELLRDNQRNMAHVTARTSGVSLGQAATDVRARLKDLALPPGYRWELAGLVGQQQQSFNSLALALAIAIAAVLAILLFQLRSFARSLAVLAATPIALVGGLAVLLVSGVPLNLSSMMGAILLIGLVVKNGILLLDHVIADEDKGIDRLTAIRNAGRARLRPILMTTLATLVALIPLALSIGAGSDMHKPLALFVLGGLALSTAASLVLVRVGIE
ncbi:MAG: efflux RND transporter permease subunit, partial [Myxococcaceae bacterium]